jgi:hypothetical protein
MPTLNFFRYDQAVFVRLNEVHVRHMRKTEPFHNLHRDMRRCPVGAFISRQNKIGGLVYRAYSYNYRQ